MKIFEYNGKTFFVPDRVNWVCWDSTGDCYGYVYKPYRMYTYDTENFVWESCMTELKLKGIIPTMVFMDYFDEEMTDLDEYSINDNNDVEYYYDEWEEHLIDVNAICIFAEGLEDL